MRTFTSNELKQFEMDVTYIKDAFREYMDLKVLETLAGQALKAVLA